MSSFNDLLNTALDDDNPFTGTAPPEGGISAGGLGLEGMSSVATAEAKAQGKCGTSFGLQVFKGGTLSVNLCGSSVGCAGKMCIRSLCTKPSHTRKIKFKTDVLVPPMDAHTVWKSSNCLVDCITPSLWSAWVSLSYPLDIWAAKFETTKRVFADTGVPLLAAMLEGEEDFRSKAETFQTPAKQRTEEGTESPFSTMLSPYAPTIKGKKPAKVDLKDLAQAVAMIEGFLDKVVSSSNLHDTQSHENIRALQGVEFKSMV
jgi:hypothetical protein